MTFTDLGLIVPSGSWTVPPYSDAWEMVAPDGSVEALPSPIQGSGASAAFTVTYETPGEMSSTAGHCRCEARPVDIRGARAANGSFSASCQSGQRIVPGAVIAGSPSPDGRRAGAAIGAGRDTACRGVSCTAHEVMEKPACQNGRWRAVGSRAKRTPIRTVESPFQHTSWPG